MATTALTPGGVESATNALQQEGLQTQLKQATDSLHNTEMEGWVAVLNEATQQYSKV